MATEHRSISGCGSMPKTSSARPLAESSTPHCAARRPPARCPRLVEVHELHDAQVVERADEREQHRGHREPDVPGGTAAWSTASLA